MDTVNGFFEFFGGFFIAISCWRLYKDKAVHGVSLWHVMLFNCWGVWNLFFYSSISLWWSLIGGIGVATANTVWTCMIVYYKWFYKAK